MVQAVPTDRFSLSSPSLPQCGLRFIWCGTVSACHAFIRIRIACAVVLLCLAFPYAALMRIMLIFTGLKV